MPRWYYWSVIAILVAGLAALVGIGATRYFEALDARAKAELAKAKLPSDLHADARSPKPFDELDINANLQHDLRLNDWKNAIRALPDGSVLLSAATATLAGGPRYLPIDGTPGTDEVVDAIVGWTATSGVAEWEFTIERSGLFAVEVVYAAQPAPIAASYLIEYDTYKLPPQLVRDTGSWTDFLTEHPGTIRLAPAGRHVLKISSPKVEGVPLMNLRSIRLLSTENLK